MPIFDYKCTECEKTTEVLVRTEKDVPTKCPHCNADNSMVKQVSSASVQLVGTGWAKDNYS